MLPDDLVEFIACPLQEIIASGRVKSIDEEYNAVIIEMVNDRGETHRQWIPIPHIIKKVRIS